ncbi:MAG: hypothetical protein WC718_04260 [Phycisphaerales bacterium]|jgi:hypothetical protein
MAKGTKVPPLHEFAEEQEKARFEENQRILNESRTLRCELRDRTAEVEELRHRLGLLETLEAARPEPPDWLTPKKKKGALHSAIPCFGLGDIHWGEKVEPDRIDGLNKYGVEIAKQRTRRAFEKAVTVPREYMAGLKFDGIQVFFTGDMVGGIIHEELKETNEEAITESVLGMAEHLSAGLGMLADEFGRVNVSAVVGNHGRLTKQMPTKNPQECMDWLVYQMVARDFRNDDRVTMDAPRALSARATVYGTNYYLTHGTQFKGGGGISGIAAPLLLGTHRATRKSAAAKKPFDVMVLGHFHQEFFWPAKGLIVCGTPKGYDEYAAFKEYEPETPRATMWLTTPEHGATSYWPLFCGDRKAEGW